MEEEVKQRVRAVVGLLYGVYEEENTSSPCPLSSPWQVTDHPSCSKPASCLGSACLISSRGDSLVATSKVLSHIRAAISQTSELGLGFGPRSPSQPRFWVEYPHYHENENENTAESDEHEFEDALSEFYGPNDDDGESPVLLTYDDDSDGDGTGIDCKRIRNRSRSRSRGGRTRSCDVTSGPPLRYEVKIWNLRPQADFCVMRPASASVLFGRFSRRPTRSISVRGRAVQTLVEGDTVYSFSVTGGYGEGYRSSVTVSAGTVALQPKHTGYGVVVSFDACPVGGDRGGVVTNATGDFLGWLNGNFSIVERDESNAYKANRLKRNASNRIKRGTIFLNGEGDGVLDSGADSAQTPSQIWAMANSKKQEKLNSSYEYVVTPSWQKVMGPIEEMFVSTGPRRKQSSEMSHVISVVEMRHDVEILRSRFEQSFYNIRIEINDDDDDDDRHRAAARFRLRPTWMFNGR